MRLLVQRYLMSAVCAVSLAGWAQSARGDDFSTVIQRRRAQMVSSKLPPSTEAMKWLRSEKRDGSWADINYTSREVSRWATADQMRRADAMAQLRASPRSPVYGNPRVLVATLAAVHWGTEHKYKNPNWWWNQHRIS